MKNLGVVFKKRANEFHRLCPPGTPRTVVSIGQFESLADAVRLAAERGSTKGKVGIPSKEYIRQQSQKSPTRIGPDHAKFATLMPPTRPYGGRSAI